MERAKFALCIGHNVYDACEPLDLAINDSTAMANMLYGMGFQVTTANNTSKRDMKNAIKQFHQALVPNCLAIFYFSGYSIQQDGINFCIPTDASVHLSADIEEDCVSLNWVIKGMTECEGCLTAVFMEAARGNPFEQQWKSTTIPSYAGLASMKPPPGVLIAFSAEPGSTISFEYAEEPNAVFTQALLEYLPAPNVALPDIMRDVRQSVLDSTNGQQRVWVQARMMEDFYIRRFYQAEAPSGRAAPAVPAMITNGAPQHRPRSPPKVTLAVANSGGPWRFAPISHPPDWSDALRRSTGKVDAQGNAVDDDAVHPSTAVDGNCVVAIDPPMSHGRHSLTLRFSRPPEETEAAHSVELISAHSDYNNATKSLAFELPNVMNCEARFDIDFTNDIMTMYTNDGQKPVALPISDLAACGEPEPYRLILYMWDAGSRVTIIQ